MARAQQQGWRQLGAHLVGQRSLVLGGLGCTRARRRRRGARLVALPSGVPLLRQEQFKVGVAPRQAGRQRVVRCLQGVQLGGALAQRQQLNASLLQRSGLVREVAATGGRAQVHGVGDPVRGRKRTVARHGTRQLVHKAAAPSAKLPAHARPGHTHFFWFLTPRQCAPHLIWGSCASDARSASSRCAASAAAACAARCALSAWATSWGRRSAGVRPHAGVCGVCRLRVLGKVRAARRMRCSTCRRCIASGVLCMMRARMRSFSAHPLGGCQARLQQLRHGRCLLLGLQLRARIIYCLLAGWRGRHGAAGRPGGSFGACRAPARSSISQSDRAARAAPAMPCGPHAGAPTLRYARISRNRRVLSARARCSLARASAYAARSERHACAPASCSGVGGRALAPSPPVDIGPLPTDAADGVWREARRAWWGGAGTCGRARSAMIALQHPSPWATPRPWLSVVP